MKHLVLALSLVGPMALPAHPQNALGPDPGPGAVTCGDFTALDTVEQRLAMLSEVQPFGDDIEPSDQNASEQWAATVTAACAGHPDRPLADAAQKGDGPLTPIPLPPTPDTGAEHSMTQAANQLEETAWAA